MFRIIPLVLLAAPLLAADPIAPQCVSLEEGTRTLGEIIASLRKQTTFEIDISRMDAAKQIIIPKSTDLPFWKTIETLATQADCRVILSNRGKTLALFPGKAATLPSLDGAFRVVAKSITARRDLETARSNYDLTLEINWEPRFPVFRIDSEPTLSIAIDDRGHVLRSQPAKSRSPVRDSFCFTANVRLDAPAREARKLEKLEGTFTVTASPKMLTFEFDDLTAKLPVVKTQDKVNVSLKRVDFTNNFLDVALELRYPEGPVFESFESWLDDNKLVIVSPDRTKTFTPQSASLDRQGQQITASYRFKLTEVGDRTGWRLLYQTPAPLVEFPVKFSLKDITLP